MHLTLAVILMETVIALLLLIKSYLHELSVHFILTGSYTDYAVTHNTQDSFVDKWDSLTTPKPDGQHLTDQQINNFLDHILQDQEPGFAGFSIKHLSLRPYTNSWRPDG